MVGFYPPLNNCLLKIPILERRHQERNCAWYLLSCRKPFESSQSFSSTSLSRQQPKQALSKLRNS